MIDDKQLAEWERLAGEMAGGLDISTVPDSVWPAVNAFPALIAEVRRLRVARDEAEAALDFDCRDLTREPDGPDISGLSDADVREAYRRVWVANFKAWRRLYLSWSEP